MMITFKDLERMYQARISKKCKRSLGDKIADDYPQAMISKALEYNDFTDDEWWELDRRGGWNASEYPGLKYLCTVYIHPLTAISGLMNKIYRTGDKDLIKAMLP